jgi:arylformamidase
MEVSVPAEFLSIADDRRRQESGCVFAGPQQPNAIRIRVVRPESGPSVGLSARHVPERYPENAEHQSQHNDQRDHPPILAAPPTGFKPPRPRSLTGEPPTAAIYTVALSRFIDLSHPVVAGMETYRPLPVPRAEILNDYDASRYDGKSEFLIASLHLCGNTGTYVDSPRHRFRTGVDLAGLSLERLADLPVVVADATGVGRAIGPDALPIGDLSGKAVLVRTDFSDHWGTDSYFSANPFLTSEGCDRLVASGVAFVGIDSLNIDDIADMARPAHTILLGAGIPICEHMTNLASLESGGGRLHAVPISWVGGATFPVRAYVVVDQ